MRQRGGCRCGALHRQDRILQPKLRGLDDGRHSADSPAVWSALPLLEWVVRDLIKVGAWDYQFSLQSLVAGALGLSGSTRIPLCRRRHDLPLSGPPFASVAVRPVHQHARVCLHGGHESEHGSSHDPRSGPAQVVVVPPRSSALASGDLRRGVQGGHLGVFGTVVDCPVEETRTQHRCHGHCSLHSPGSVWVRYIPKYIT